MTTSRGGPRRRRLRKLCHSPDGYCLQTLPRINLFSFAIVPVPPISLSPLLRRFSYVEEEVLKRLKSPSWVATRELLFPTTALKCIHFILLFGILLDLPIFADDNDDGNVVKL